MDISAKSPTSPEVHIMYVYKTWPADHASLGLLCEPKNWEIQLGDDVATNSQPPSDQAPLLAFHTNVYNWDCSIPCYRHTGHCRLLQTYKSFTICRNTVVGCCVHITVVCCILKLFTGLKLFTTIEMLWMDWTQTDHFPAGKEQALYLTHIPRGTPNSSSVESILFLKPLIILLELP